MGISVWIQLLFLKFHLMTEMTLFSSVWNICLNLAVLYYDWLILWLTTASFLFLGHVHQVHIWRSSCDHWNHRECEHRAGFILFPSHRNPTNPNPKIINSCTPHFFPQVLENPAWDCQDGHLNCQPFSGLSFFPDLGFRQDMRYHNESKDLRQCAPLKTSIEGAVIDKMSLIVVFIFMMQPYSCHFIRFFYLVRFITSISSTCFS